MDIMVFGAIRTGTTWTSEMIKLNVKGANMVQGLLGNHLDLPITKERYDTMIRKTTLKPLDAHNIFPVIVIKNPYSWYYSVKRYWDDRAGFDFRQEYALYNNLYKGILPILNGEHFLYSEGLIIRYEDILNAPRNELRRVGKTPNKIINPTLVDKSEEFTEERKAFYLSGGTFGLDEETINKINEAVDWDTMKMYGYGRWGQ